MFVCLDILVDTVSQLLRWRALCGPVVHPCGRCRIHYNTCFTRRDVSIFFLGFSET